MWCRNCNIELKDKKCPICGNDAVEDVPVEIFWCSKCRVPVLQEVSQADKGICPRCGGKMKYMSSDIRPVFPEERLLLEILLDRKPNEYIEKSVWAINSRYYIDGKSVSLPSSLFKTADADKYDADIVDCIGDACIGLIIAVDKYDPGTSGPFGSYASLWMLQNVSREQKTQRANVYYPVHKKEQYYTMYPILKDRGCTTCDKVWICREVRRIVQSRLECANEQAEDVILQTLAFDSLDEMCENTVSEGKDIFDKHEKRIYRLFIEKLGVIDDTEDIIGEQEMREVVNEVLNTLTDREQKVIRDRFGFGDGKEKTLEEVGADFGVTRERIRQIETKALKKLRRFSRIKQLESYI